MIYTNFVELLPSFKSIGLLVLEKKMFKNTLPIKKVFAIYSHGGHLGNVTLTIYVTINCSSPIPRILHIKFSFDWSSGY